MNKEKLKDNHGNLVLSIILILIIIILMIIIFYEMINIGIIKISSGKKTPLYIADYENYMTENTIISIENGELYNQIIDENNEIKNNNYYYNQLDNTAKIIYKALESNIENMQTGEYKIEFTSEFDDILANESGEEKLKTAFQSAWNAFTYDHVEVFYIDISKLVLTTQTKSIGNINLSSKVDLSKGNNENYLTDEISSVEELRKKILYIKRVREKIVSQLNGYSEYEQIKYLHDWMVDNFSYDKTISKPDIHNIYGAFVNREVVCEGYARAFKYVLDGLGIDNVLISGTATNSYGETETHAWNYVKLDGKWYGVDVTWDDPIITGGGGLSDDYRYLYFMKGSNSFLLNHKEDGFISDNSMEFKFPILEKENY